MATGGEIDTDILSDEIFDVLCSMCKNRGINTEGENFCIDCHDYFCINCVKVHNQVPVLASHKVLDKSQVKLGTSKALPRAPAERCDRHSHKHIDMYCQNHDNVGCTTCMAIDHRSCKDIFYIPEFILNKSYQVASREIQTKLKALTKILAVQANKFQQDKQNLLKRKAELLDDIRQLRQEINDQLDKLEESSVVEIENKFKLLEDKIEEGLKQLQAHKAKVTSANDKLASPNPNQAELFVHIKMGEDAENVANKFIKDTKKKITVSGIEFQPDRKLLQQLKENKTLGMLTEKTIKTDNNLLQITGGQSYCVKDKSDEKICDIYGACYMEDGKIILVDHNNKKLKRLDSHNYTITDCYSLPGYPYQICKINETQVAVTLRTKQEIHFISVDRKMKTTNKIKTDFICYSLAYANNHLYISDDISVYIYTMSGRKLKQFSTDQSGQKLFSGTNSLAVSKDATQIYVADSDKGLIVLDNNGQIVTTFNGKQLQIATYCHLTEAGSVLVSGYNSNNVLQFTSEGELIVEIIKADSGKQGINSVCCNEQMSKMCISREDEDNIEVYDI
ncbi:uncharacterized protein LOC132758853 isoform X3 [Ruditapes philippinarum]|uniref:uncharacterized protein LOC132758853 isoform X3 n=1 Tax=Ruditapes philippinarum TaxID=129788 RepID=UPI00295ABB3C|nr:uncharacterized protein LOC132758853 isoform X3 [Ruditapes philippinarum]